MIKSLIVVGLGGAFGAIARFLVSQMVQGPVSTLLVNCLGCGLLGVLVAYVSVSSMRPELQLALQVGVLGSLTTFSAFVMDFEKLLTEDSRLRAYLYLLASVLLGLGVFILSSKLAIKHLF